MTWDPLTRDLLRGSAQCQGSADPGSTRGDPPTQNPLPARDPLPCPRCPPRWILTRLIRALIRSKSILGIILREIWFWLGST